MDQDSSSNPSTQAPAGPVSSDITVSDESATNPAVVSVSDTSATTIADNPIVDPVVAPDPATAIAPEPVSNSEVQGEVVKKIAEAQNVLVALSGNPSVDEMAAAIGLSLFLDKLGKRATAIYSGSTPNALEFLKPEETFDATADTLQDFVIALNKDKADHLRYKLDGDYVKIFITPYKTRISEEDLEFSYGDFNVDLVLALDVANGIDLDAALREHGRIMHDAVIVNITTGNPGRFGEIEWSDKSASSVSEMIAKLLYSVDSKTKIDKEEATAFLTGIVAATNRFSNAKTTPDTMQIASRLMQSGANQQLISKNITPDVDNELYSLLGDNTRKRNTDPTNLDIEHGSEEVAVSPDSDASKEADTPAAEANSTLLDDLKAAEVSLATAGSETVPDTSHQPVKLEDASDNTAAVETELNANPDIVTESEPTTQEVPAASFAEPTVPSEPASPTEPVLPPVMLSSDFVTEPTAAESTPGPVPGEEGIISNDKPEKVIQPPAGMDLSSPDEGPDKYGKMLEDAIAGLGSTTAPAMSSEPVSNPASMMAPPVASNPEINGVPEMNYMPLPGEEVLPPPPTPPIDMSAPAPEAPIVNTEPIAPAESVEPIQPATPPAEPTPTPLGPQPSMQDQVYVPQATDPGAFKIPGM